MKLKIAIQKSGRLHDDSISLLRDAGVRIENGEDKLLVTSSNFPLEVLSCGIPIYLNTLKTE